MYDSGNECGNHPLDMVGGGPLVDGPALVGVAKSTLSLGLNVGGIGFRGKDGGVNGLPGVMCVSSRSRIYSPRRRVGVAARSCGKSRDALPES